MTIVRKKSYQEADVYQAAIKRINECYDRFDKVFVNFSGGKDSTCVLNLAIEVARSRGRLPVSAIFFDEEAIHPPTIDYVRRVSLRTDEVKLFWYCLPVKHRNACSNKQPYWYCWDPKDKDRWVREYPPEGIDTHPLFTYGMSWAEFADQMFPASLGTVCTLTGVRTQESFRRFKAVSQKRNDNYITSRASNQNTYTAHPIYDWSSEDVWIAVKKLGWDYNCNPYEAPILMGDYTFKPIGEIKEGDMILGWDKEGDVKRTGNYSKARLKKVKVLNVFKRESPTVKITFESGRVIRCTENHKWLHVNQHRNYYSYNPAEVGVDLCHVVDIDFVESTPESLWLGGLYDGEACGDRIYQSPKHNPEIYAHIRKVLKDLKIPFKELNGKSDAQNGFRISGGRKGLIKFLNLCKPIKRSKWHDEIILGSKFRTPDKVVSIEPVIEQESVYALQTETGNYICWGYASSNSTYDIFNRTTWFNKYLAQRVCPPFGEEPLRGLWMYAECFPSLWHRMLYRVEGVATAWRYSNTELYGIGKSEKPGDIKWKDYLGFILDSYPSHIKGEVVKNLNQIIDRHYQKTRDEIPEAAFTHRGITVPTHPLTGTSWEFLCKLAIKGDLKGRTGPTLENRAILAQKKLGINSYEEAKKIFGK